MWSLRDMVPSLSSKSNQVRDLSSAYLWSVFNIKVHTSIPTHLRLRHILGWALKKWLNYTRPTQRVWLENLFGKNLVGSGLNCTCTLAVSGEKYAWKLGWMPEEIDVGAFQWMGCKKSCIWHCQYLNTTVLLSAPNQALGKKKGVLGSWLHSSSRKVELWPCLWPFLTDLFEQNSIQDWLFSLTL